MLIPLEESPSIWIPSTFWLYHNQVFIINRQFFDGLFVLIGQFVIKPFDVLILFRNGFQRCFASSFVIPNLS